MCQTINKIKLNEQLETKTVESRNKDGR